MQPHDTRKYLFDIAEACDLIGQFVAGKNFSDYKNDPLLRSGVERQFEIIGEALNQALRYDPALATKISSTPRIIAFRNQLIHRYAVVSDDVVWGVIETNLPVLTREVKLLLERSGT
jgi:uncharacterized protein with HEPN domain